MVRTSRSRTSRPAYLRELSTCLSFYSTGELICIRLPPVTAGDVADSCLRILAEAAEVQPWDALPVAGGGRAPWGGAGLGVLRGARAGRGWPSGVFR